MVVNNINTVGVRYVCLNAGRLRYNNNIGDAPQYTIITIIHNNINQLITILIIYNTITGWQTRYALAHGDDRRDQTYDMMGYVDNHTGSYNISQ